MKSDNTIVYKLKGGRSPLSFNLPTQHTKRCELLIYDEENKKSRALRYASNHPSYFIDEQEGEVILKHLYFEDGEMIVNSKEKGLVGFLEIHPWNEKNGGNTFYRVDFDKMAKDAEEALDAEFAAQAAARDMTMEGMKEFMKEWRPEDLDRLHDSEIRRDIKAFSKSSPIDFMNIYNHLDVADNSDMAADVEKIIEAGLITVRKNGGIHYNLEDNRKQIVKYSIGNEEPDEVLAEFFKYGDGFKIYEELMSMLNN